MPPTPAESAPDRDFVDALTEQWAEERPELETRDLAIDARIMRLHRILRGRADAAVADTELNPRELNVLAALRRSGAPHCLTPSELSRSLLLSSGAMTNRIDRLEERGLVERLPEPGDRRKVRVRLTDAGVDLIDHAMDTHVASLADAFDVLEPAEREQLGALLRRVLAKLE